jgi:hypothetical protein
MVIVKCPCEGNRIFYTPYDCDDEAVESVAKFIDADYDSARLTHEEDSGEYYYRGILFEVIWVEDTTEVFY